MGFLIEPPLLPMLAKRVDAIPCGDRWSFEPKWDGFRAVIFRSGEELMIQSRDGKGLDRYFPELREPLLAALPERCVLDGEVVIAATEGLDFDALQLRVHPAASRVKMLSETTPASVVFFDLLAVGEKDLRGKAFAERRRGLEELAGGFGESSNATGAVVPLGAWGGARTRLHLTPATTDHAVAEDWFSRFEGAGLDGVMAKGLDSVYTPDKRTMLKIKHERDCDCVVAGFRWHKDGKAEDGSGTLVGSLLLGLYDDAGALQHVGVCASFTAAKRKELVEFLEPYRKNALDRHPWAGWATEAAAGSRMPGGKSRWTGGKDLSWVALRPELVVEVAYEHMQGDRFRHMAQFRRWRSDKRPEDCTYEQLEVVAPQELMEIFARRQ
jgi:ATP-dependent DNA ligase